MEWFKLVSFGAACGDSHRQCRGTTSERELNMFSGRQYKGAMRDYRKEKRLEAYRRQMRLWNNGTGRIHRDEAKPSLDSYKRVLDPTYMLKISER